LLQEWLWSGGVRGKSLELHLRETVLGRLLPWLRPWNDQRTKARASEVLTSMRCETVMKTSQKHQPTPYATHTDLCRVFEEEMNSLYLLSFLLTADHKRAKQCFVSGLENATEGPPVFREWANSWARRTIIQSAIRFLNLRPADEHSAHLIERSFDDATFPTNQAQITAILELPSFERFVFVMSVLERYSNQECSLLLGCARQDVIAAQTRALQQIGNSIELNREAARQ
jgi:DNA-directed RNA polymerase specialized sigma24 family protein